MKTTQQPRTLYLVKVILYNLKFSGKWHSDVRQTWFNWTETPRNPADFVENWTELNQAARGFTQQFIDELLDQDDVDRLKAHFRTDPNVKAFSVFRFDFPLTLSDDKPLIGCGAVGISATTSYSFYIDRSKGIEYAGYFTVPM
jgi:hypothetical protein